MNKDVAIKVESLSKEYRLYDKHINRVKEVFHPFRRKYHHTFTALNNISFSINKGEFFGVIGRNGCGKSTLLQIICGIMSPTKGKAIANGRIAALLELGAGFNPEFTGRENVYLNGSLLGFSEQEVDEIFDEIVDFAEIGEFIEQPVKTYSSGMFVRLAFAVQACVTPDILIVDEALAVGDIFFRQKCYQRLQELINGGCTVLLVTHSMSDIEQFCDQALLLHQGEVAFLGDATEAVKRYYWVEQEARNIDLPRSDNLETKKIKELVRNEENDAGFFWPDDINFLDIANFNQVSHGCAKCTGVAVCDAKGNACYSFQQQDIISIFFEFRLLKKIDIPIAGVELVNEKGVIVHGKTTLEHNSFVPSNIPEGSLLRFRQDVELNIAPGEYSFNIGFAALTAIDYSQRSSMPHRDLSSKIILLCNVPKISTIEVRLKDNWEMVQLFFHGVANLPGKCETQLVNSN